MTHAIAVSDLEELLQEEIPCEADGGCRRGAQLRSAGHACVDPGPFHLCIQCWQEWFSRNVLAIKRYGWIVCDDCGQAFTTVEAFNDYRPF